MRVLLPLPADSNRGLPDRESMVSSTEPQQLLKMVSVNLGVRGDLSELWKERSVNGLSLKYFVLPCTCNIHVDQKSSKKILL